MPEISTWKKYQTLLAEVKAEFKNVVIPPEYDTIYQQTRNRRKEIFIAKLQQYRQEKREELALRNTEYKHIRVATDAKTLSTNINIDTETGRDIVVPEVETAIQQLIARLDKKQLGPGQTFAFLVKLIYTDGNELGELFENIGHVVKRMLEWWEKYETVDGYPVAKIEIKVIIADPDVDVPPMAFTQNDTQPAVNCVLEECIRQTHKKKLKKEEFKMFMTIQDIEALEAKHKINVFITDSFNKLWRKPDIRYPKRSKSQPVDVFIKCHNYHASKAKRFRISDVAIPVPPLIKTASALISNFYISKTKDAVVYLTSREIMNLHIDLLKASTIHHCIDDGYKLLGLIVLNDKGKPIDYKDGNLTKYAFIDLCDWSLSGYARRVFKTSVKKKYVGMNHYQLQISDGTVYENIQKSQVPVTVLFQQKAIGNIIQIDMTRAYKNASIGNLDIFPKQFYQGFPAAPRNIRNIDQDLSPLLLKQLSALGLGFALITFDQTEHIATGDIPLLHTGKPHPKGETVLSLPALEYYALFPGVKVFVKQYYFSRHASHTPFDEPMAIFDQHLKDTEHHLKSDEYRKIRQLGNLLIGGLNKRHHRCKVFSTSSMAEVQRFLSDDTKRIHRFQTIDRYEDRIKFLDNADGDDVVTLHKEHIFYYQEKGEEVFESFNMTHLSKYVLDYQKIALHHKTRQVCKNNAKNLLCINTDSITYIAPPTLDSPSEITRQELSSLWHTEATGTAFYGYSNGVRAVSDKKAIVYQRHSGYKNELTLDQYKVLSDKHNLKVYYHSKTYASAKEYDTALESTPLPGQRLHTLFRPAGYGKTEFAKYISGKESKFTQPAVNCVLPDLPQYDPDDMILCATTHVARKLINGKYTLTGLITRLARGVLKDSIANVKAILIDEVSMTSAGQLNSLDGLLRSVRRINRPFGGLDIYLVGHMKQLPNVDEDSKPVTEHPLVKTIFTSLNQYLPVNHRQSTDTLFQSILDKIENYYEVGGDAKSEHRARHVLPQILTAEELDALTDRVVEEEPTRADYFATPLNYKNIVAERYNREIGIIQPGEEVIIRFNRGKFCNGDRHLIKGVKEDPKKGRLVKINGNWLEYDKYFQRQKDKSGKLEAFPKIQLAWSMTIHCSQGQTLDNVFLYAKTLNMNMLYVAMSRVRSLNNLYFANLF